MGKEIINQVQKAQIGPGRTNPRKNTLRHIVIKLAKSKARGKILKGTREKRQLTYKVTPIRLISHQKFYKSQGSDMIYLK